MIPSELINKDYLYAIVGANNDPTRYGYIILNNLFSKGYKVVGVNPKYNKVDLVDCYPSLKNIPTKPEVVVFVVPPAVGLEILDEVKELNINKVWFQPGAYDQAIIDKVKKLGLVGVTDGSCVMVLANYVK